MTKADAALRILGTPVALKLELRRNTTKYVSFLDERLGPGDDFYVRAAFSLSPLSEAVGYGAEERVPALPITCGDIFHVTDSLYNGSFSSWLNYAKKQQGGQIRVFIRHIFSFLVEVNVRIPGPTRQPEYLKAG
ncbi:unnamed protein product [Dibothriocephalus latus]|uniref:Uncharacterized protein n=1 Tax=Dibothriocephalus latus TaxID=60516 RepID=A0A3P7LRD5_DIBLA|nr:unnamed protein product [Dibothriocephalus latus]